jgi:hypothetical protein
VYGSCARPNPEAEAEAEAESREPTWAVTAPSQTQQPAHQPSLHCQLHVLLLWSEYSGQSNSTASLTSTPILVNAAHTPSDSASGAFASLAWIGSDEPVARQRRSVQSVAACAVRCGIVHRWHSVATQWMWLQYIGLRCCATLVLSQADVSEGSSGETDVRGGMDSAAVQMWAGDGLVRMADVGWGWTLSRCRGGQGIDSVQLPMWAGGRTSRGGRV